MALVVCDDPASPVERNGGVGEVRDSDEVDERMSRIGIHRLSVVKIDEAIQCGS